MLLNDADKVYVGATEVDKVYVGATEVWSASPPLVEYVDTYSTSVVTQWTVPDYCTSLSIDGWGGGGASGPGTGGNAGGGGGGAAYAANTVAVVPGHVIEITVGATNVASRVRNLTTGGTDLLLAVAGVPSTGSGGAAGGQAANCIGTTTMSGSPGSARTTTMSGGNGGPAANQAGGGGARGVGGVSGAAGGAPGGGAGGGTNGSHPGGVGRIRITFNAPAGRPGPPTSLMGSGGHMNVQLTWNAPATPGVPAYTGFNVKNVTTGETRYVADNVGSVSYTWSGLTNGTPYTFEVRTTNGAWESSPVHVVRTPQTPP